MSDTRKLLTPADLPMELPEPCPVCGAKMEMVSIAYFTLRFGYFAPQIRCGAMKPAFDAGGERWESWRSAHAMVDADRLKAISDRMFNHLNDAYRWEVR